VIVGAEGLHHPLRRPRRCRSRRPWSRVLVRGSPLLHRELDEPRHRLAQFNVAAPGDDRWSLEATTPATRQRSSALLLRGRGSSRAGSHQHASGRLRIPAGPLPPSVAEGAPSVARSKRSKRPTVTCSPASATFLSLHGDRLVATLEHERDAASAQVACLNALLEGSADSLAARHPRAGGGPSRTRGLACAAQRRSSAEWALTRVVGRRWALGGLDRLDQVALWLHDLRAAVRPPACLQPNRAAKRLRGDRPWSSLVTCHAMKVRPRPLRRVSGQSLEQCKAVGEATGRTRAAHRHFGAERALTRRAAPAACDQVPLLARVELRLLAAQAALATRIPSRVRMRVRSASNSRGVGVPPRRLLGRGDTSRRE
jgi:hypothetical protein